MKYLVTGGAGFIGSHIVDRLLKEGHEVVVYDNFSTGKMFFLKHLKGNKKLTIVKADLLDTKKLDKAMKGVGFVFHIAGYADVRSGLTDHHVNHIQNLEVTHAVLEAMHKHKVKKIAFSSTSSVYGDAEVHPTGEDVPFAPTSLYGAAKASSEQYICAYAHYYDWNAYIFRFVSFVGERYTHGIIFDLLKKVEKNKKILELLSDGTPRKSSVYVHDGVEAIFKGIQKGKNTVNIFNIGHDDIMTVDEIVNTILDEAKISITKKYQGGKRGWKGDNNFVHLDNRRLKKLGWKPKVRQKEGIRRTVRYLLENKELLK
jgi:UDP-glucose 4-epimerase